MYQKDVVKKAWEAAGLYRSRKPKLRQFLKQVDESTTHCWEQFAQAIRERYYDYLEEIVVPLWQTGEKLLRLNLIRLAEPSRKKEQALLEEWTRRCDPKKEDLELRALIRTGSKPALDQILKHKRFPERLKVLAKLQRARTTR